MKKRFSKLKRCIIVFSLLVLVFSFSFSVAAFDTYYIDMPITQPTISDSLSYFEVSVRRSSDGAVIGYTFLVSHKSMDESSDVPVSVSLYEDGTRHIVKIYNHTDFPITVSYVDSQGYVKNFESALLNGDAIEYRLPYSLVTIKSYGNIFVRDYKGFNTGSIVFQYGSTAKTNKLLASILSALEEQSGSTGSIVGAIEGSTDEITNGWQESEGPDTTITDEYGEQDAALQESTSVGRSETISIFNNFGALFQSEGHLYRGLLSVTAIFSELTKIEWVGSILNFSLALGVFAFVIGTSVHVFRSAHERPGSKKEISKSEQGD